MFAGSTRVRSLWTPKHLEPLFWFDAMDLSTLTIVDNKASVWVNKVLDAPDLVQADSNLRPQVSTSTFGGRRSLLCQTTTVTMALEEDIPMPSQAALFFVLDTTNAVPNRYSILFGRASNNPVNTPAPYLGMQGKRLNNYYQHDRYAPTFSSNGLDVLGFEHRATEMRFYKNGSMESLSLAVTLEVNSRWSNAFSFPGVPGQAPIGIYFGEMLAVQGPVDTNMADKLSGYLAHKWGLVGNLPSNHPFKNYPPRGV